MLRAGTACQTSKTPADGLAEDRHGRGSLPYAVTQAQLGPIFGCLYFTTRFALTMFPVTLRSPVVSPARNKRLV